MSILPIRVWPHSDLRVVADPVTDFGPVLQQLVSDMAETMYTNKGVGLAATQVGIPLRILVMDCASEDQDSRFFVLINHVVSSFSSDLLVRHEGCLSFPGVWEEVARPSWVEGYAVDASGTRFNFRYEGLEAQCVQHEGEHLEGKVLVDHLSRTKRRFVEKTLRNRRG